ncbi:MAG TPA: DUF5957 family protein [Pyrinomonadaceae bacterium]
MNKDALKGAGLALVAAYLFGCLLVLFSARGAPELSQVVVTGFAGLCFSFWFVIPIGMALGVLIPKLSAGRSVGAAATGGALLGVAAGFIGGILLSLFLDWFGIGFASGKSRLLYFPFVMGIYCAPWTSAYACFRRDTDQALRQT